MLLLYFHCAIFHFKPFSKPNAVGERNQFCRQLSSGLVENYILSPNMTYSSAINHFSFFPFFPSRLWMYFPAPVVSAAHFIPHPCSLLKFSHMLCSIRAGGKPQVRHTSLLALAPVLCTQIHVSAGLTNQLWKFSSASALNNSHIPYFLLIVPL